MTADEKKKRDAKMRKLFSEIQSRTRTLNEMGYYFSDSSSVICLFDTQKGGKRLMDMEDRELMSCIVETIYQR